MYGYLSEVLSAFVPKTLHVLFCPRAIQILLLGFCAQHFPLSTWLLKLLVISSSACFVVFFVLLCFCATQLYLPFQIPAP